MYSTAPFPTVNSLHVLVMNGKRYRYIFKRKAYMCIYGPSIRRSASLKHHTRSTFSRAASLTEWPPVRMHVVTVCLHRAETIFTDTRHVRSEDSAMRTRPCAQLVTRGALGRACCHKVGHAECRPPENTRTPNLNSTASMKLSSTSLRACKVSTQHYIERACHPRQIQNYVLMVVQAGK